MINQKTQKNLRHIGKVKSARGLKGEIFITLFSNDNSWCDRIQTVWLADSSGSHFEKFDVKVIKPYKEGLSTYLVGVTDRNQSEALCGKIVYLPSDYFKSEDHEPPFLVQIENFIICDEKTNREIGQIHRFSSNGVQDLLVVQLQNSKEEVEIPFVDSFVNHIDYDHKKIMMTLPEGLLEINSKEVQGEDD